MKNRNKNAFQLDKQNNLCPISSSSGSLRKPSYLFIVCLVQIDKIYGVY